MKPTIEAAYGVKVAFNPPLAGMVVETYCAGIPSIPWPFNPPLAGMVVETLSILLFKMEPLPFNPPLAGMVVETSIILGVKQGMLFQPTPSWDGS